MREGDDFARALDTLNKALGTDLEWVKEHRHWLMEALRWESESRDRSLLLRGRDLKAAEAWLARQAERTEPRPTQLQTEFLLASRAWETRRLRTIAVGIGIALAVSILLGVLALLQRNHARTQAAIARSRELAVSATSQLPVDPERSLLLAIEAVRTRPTTDAKNALRRAVLASRQRAEIPTRSKQIGALIKTVAFSPDGKFVAGGSNDGTVSVASSTASQGTQAVALPTPPQSAADACSVFARGGASEDRLAFSADSRFIAAVNDRGGALVWTWPRPNKPVTSPFCLGRAGPPSLQEVVTATLENKSFPPAAVRLGAGRVVEIVRSDGRLLRWPAASRSKPTLVRLSRKPVLAAAFSASSDRIALLDAGGLSVITSARHRVAGPLPLRGAHAVAGNADGSRLAAAGGHVVSVWTPPAARPLTLRTPEIVRSVAMSPDGKSVAVGDSGNAVRVWSLERGGAPVVLRGSQGSVTAVAFSSDGKRIVSGADDGVFRVWEWDASRPPSLGGDGADESRVFLSSDGRLRRIDGLADSQSVSASRDGRRIVAAVDPRESAAVQLWDAASGSRPRTAEMPRPVNAAAVSGDGRWIGLAERGGIRVGRWPGKDLRAPAPASSGLIEYTALAFDPDGRHVAAAGYDGKNSKVSVWTLPPAGRPSAGFEILGYVPSLAFSHDGARLAAAGSDGAVSVWNLTDAGAPLVLRGHHGAANSVAFSPDGNEVVSGGHDGTLRIWELAEDGKSVSTPGLGGAVTDVAFTPDGKDVVALSVGGSRIWRCDFCGPIDDVLAHAQRMTTRALTPEERALFLHER